MTVKVKFTYGLKHGRLFSDLNKTLDDMMEDAMRKCALQIQQRLINPKEQTMAKKLEWMKAHYSLQSKCNRFSIYNKRHGGYMLVDRSAVYKNHPNKEGRTIYKLQRQAKERAQLIINEEEKDMKKKKRYIKTTSEQADDIQTKLGAGQPVTIPKPMKLYYVCRNRMNPIVEVNASNDDCGHEGQHRMCGNWQDAHTHLLHLINDDVIRLAVEEEDLYDELEKVEKMKEPKSK